jgi:hypothetical protein
MRNNLKVIVLLLVLFISASCSFFSLPGSPIAENPATVGPTEAVALPSSTPGSSPATQIVFPEFGPTPTPPSPEVTPAPTSLNTTGPYVLFKGQDGIWVTNPDGSFPTLVSQFETQGDLRQSISPAGDRMARVVRTDQGLDLVMVKIPGGETETIAHLLSISREEQVYDPTSQKAFALYAIWEYDSVAWQPGTGRMLAFMGAINGSSSDLYLYDTQTGEIKQMTDGPSQAISPSWSPDGQVILHYGVSWVPPFGGAIGRANQLDGAWAVQASDGKVVTMPKPKSTYPNFVGWQDDSHYLTYDSSDECYSQNLRSVSVVNGGILPILDNSFYYEIAQSPENGALLISSQDGCANSLGEGMFLFLPGQTSPIRILNKPAYELRWMPESRVFFAYPEALFSSDGNTRYDPPVYDASYEPAVSKNGYQAWEVIENYQGRVMVKVPGAEWQSILDGFVKQLIWDPGNGETLLIALEDGSLYAASYPDFTPHLMGNLGSNIDQAIWLP